MTWVKMFEGLWQATTEMAVYSIAYYPNSSNYVLSVRDREGRRLDISEKSKTLAGAKMFAEQARCQIEAVTS